MGDHHEPPDGRMVGWVVGLALLLLIGGALLYLALGLTTVYM